MLALGHKAEMIAEMPYAELQCMLDDPPGYRNYWSAEYLDEPSRRGGRRLLRGGAAAMIVPSPSQHVLFPGGGAVARETADWPVPWRHAPWCVHPFGLWTDPADDARGIAWVRGLRGGDAALGDRRHLPQLHRRRGRGAGRRRARRARTTGGWREVKADYDPENVFHLNHNIRPA